jgi:dTDP-4-dehydrorhamnose 3,5-epimerase
VKNVKAFLTKKKEGSLGMEIKRLGLVGVFLLEPQVFGDARGWFYESYNQATLAVAGISAQFVQDNRSYSAKKGTLRGLHCQLAPFAQGKLFMCTRGAVLDVAADARLGSPTYGLWVGVLLSAENKRQLWIPKGCLHGFLTLADDTEVFYKTDAPYAQAHERSVRYDDPFFGVNWELTAPPTLSQKDADAPYFEASDIRFSF